MAALIRMVCEFISICAVVTFILTMPAVLWNSHAKCLFIHNQVYYITALRHKTDPAALITFFHKFMEQSRDSSSRFS